MKSMQHAFIALAAAALLAGCSSTPLDANVPVENRPTDGQAGAGGTGAGGTFGGAGAGAAGAAQSRVVPVDLTKTDSVAVSNLPRMVYFDFDSYVIKDEYRGTVEAHAKALVADRKLRLTVEGHTDERGGREYNLALGQKRAEAVLKALSLLGAGAGQVEAVSFGEERPAVQGSDEAAWAKNRRAELNNR
ncbi:MAG: peptidoglycan-associated lipoprotein Pal [Rhizobacter sp.]|nr:peptidoglycan-associated lipoprotein Pal [Rhizobacter sp.]